MEIYRRRTGGYEWTATHHADTFTVRVPSPLTLDLSALVS